MVPHIHTRDQSVDNKKNLHDNLVHHLWGKQIQIHNVISNDILCYIGYAQGIRASALCMAV